MGRNRTGTARTIAHTVRVMGATIVTGRAGTPQQNIAFAHGADITHATGDFYMSFNAGNVSGAMTLVQSLHSYTPISISAGNGHGTYQ